ncbi:hypothetical protein BJX61DRAFT_295603 [Aspergillus egyptiacus]|nr:hypothetical protein BJX61DRAFT_295603 [Aspergillus egyptiacus]
MAQANLQPGPKAAAEAGLGTGSPPFRIAAFPWLCLAISFLFVTVRNWGRISQFYARFWRLQVRLWPWFEFSGRYRGLIWSRRSGEYTCVDREDQDRDSDGDADGIEAGDILLNSIPNAELVPETRAHNHAPVSNEKRTTHSVSKYFHPRTSLLYNYVLEPPSPRPITPTTQEQGNTQPLRLSNQNQRDTYPPASADNTTTTNAKTGMGIGMLHALVEAAVRGFEDLHESGRFHLGSRDPSLAERGDTM